MKSILIALVCSMILPLTAWGEIKVVERSCDRPEVDFMNKDFRELKRLAYLGDIWREMQLKSKTDQLLNCVVVVKTKNGKEVGLRTAYFDQVFIEKGEVRQFGVTIEYQVQTKNTVDSTGCVVTHRQVAVGQVHYCRHPRMCEKSGFKFAVNRDRVLWSR